MMYTRERLMKAVREAGRAGQPFTLGEVRAELGLKGCDKRELKRFRSRFRECGQVLGHNLEKLGPNTFRLNAAYAAAHPPATPAVAAPVRKMQASLPAKPARLAEQAPARLIDRVAVSPAELGEALPARRPREQVGFVTASASGAAQPSFGDRLSAWLGRSRTQHTPRVQNNHNDSAAAVALSRLAVDLQPKAAGFEYRWIDGKLQVQRADK